MRASERRRGTYVLFLALDSPFSSVIGALGHVDLPAGTYCYVGSAMCGLEQRLDRHISKDKKVRWHIDRLTLAADSLWAYVSHPDPIPECELAELAADAGCEPALDGFGCSDCRCRTHLFSVTQESEDFLIKSASLKKYVQGSPPY